MTSGKQIPRVTIREDEFSSQGILTGDGKFFLRRLRGRDSWIFTDVSFGRQSAHVSSALLAEFFEKTGGLEPGRLLFRDISPTTSEKEVVGSRFDQLVPIVQAALSNLDLESVNPLLDLEMGKFNAVFEARHKDRAT